MRTDDHPTTVGAVVLRPIEPADVDAWFAYMTRAEVLAHTSWTLAHRDELVALIERLTPDDDAPARFAIVDRDDRTLLGTIGFPLVSSVHRTAEIAYDLAPTAWGRGIATACCRALADWALHARGFVRVQATAVDSNRASQRVLEKSGFAFEGRLANLKTIRGVPRDFLLFARTTRPSEPVEAASAR